MLLAIAHLALVWAALVSGASIFYCLLCVWLGVQFAAPSSGAQGGRIPPVSILKPIKGPDPDMYEALRSHFLQDYPDYEILFGIPDSNDAAFPIIERLRQEFPNRKIVVVTCEKRLGANGKVSSLAQLVPFAANEVLLVNDSDIRVTSGYLRTVMGELQQAGTGLVTCLYRGTTSDTLGSKLESLGISTDFVAGVLVARTMERGLHFGLGSTLAFRKSDLVAVGHFESLVDYLADDYELGRRIAEHGNRVVLSNCVVETHLPAYSLTGFVSHQLRWARTIRASRPLGYAGLLFTFTLPWAFTSLLMARGAIWASWLFVAAVVSRFAMALVSAGLVLRDQNSLRLLWLLPVRDFIAPVIWAMGLAGRKIVWRGEAFSLKHGKLKRKDPRQ